MPHSIVGDRVARSFVARKQMSDVDRIERVVSAAEFKRDADRSLADPLQVAPVSDCALHVDVFITGHALDSRCVKLPHDFGWRPHDQ